MGKKFHFTQQGAETVTYLASSPEVDGVSGKYFVNKQTRRSSTNSYNAKIAGKLDQVSQVMTGLGNSIVTQAFSSPWRMVTA